MANDSIEHLINHLILLNQAQKNPNISAKVKEMKIIYLNKELYENSLYKIIKKLCPCFLDENVNSTQSEFENAFSKLTFPDKEIDLSNLYIENIPKSLAEKMTNIEKLSLFYSKNLKLDDEWFYLLSKKLKELSLVYCNLNEDNLKVIASLELLEKLDISACDNLNINSPHFITILKKLKYFDISRCKLDEKALEIIYLNAPKLEFLGFSSNNLSNFSFTEQSILPKFKKSLKVLNLIDCNLKSHDLEKFFIFNNLEEIDLSSNDFSDIDEETIEKLFKSTEKNVQTHSNKSIERISSNLAQLFTDKKDKPLYRAYTSQLKSVELSNCKISSELFVTKLFDLENLENLKISRSKIQFNFEQLQKSKAYEKLKVLEVAFCEGLNSGNLKSLTSFPNLEILDASFNNFENLPEGFTLGCSKDSLKELKINSSKLNINGLKAITDCTNLKILEANNNIFESLTKKFEFGRSKESLEELHISHCFWNFSVLKKIAELPRLRILHFNNNGLNTWNSKEIIDQLSKRLQEFQHY